MFVSLDRHSLVWPCDFALCSFVLSEHDTPCDKTQGIIPVELRGSSIVLV